MRTCRCKAHRRRVMPGHHHAAGCVFLVAAMLLVAASSGGTLAADWAPVPNPSFEEGAYGPDAAPAGWAFSTTGTARCRWAPEGRTGKCIALENIAHEDQAIARSDLFPITPYHNYRLSFWHRARDPIARHAEVWIYFGETNPNAGCRNFTVTASRQWQERVVEFTAPNLRETFLWFILCAHSENSAFYADDLRLEDLGPAKITPETIRWTLEDTSVEKSVGGIFTRVEGPKTSRPLAHVVPLTALAVLNTAPPQTPVVDGLIGESEYAPWAASIGPLRSLSDGGPTQDRTWAWLTYDDRRLYVAWKATYRGRAPLSSIPPDDRDGHVNVDDCVEVLFAPPDGPLFHVIGNAAGALYDERDGDLRWNAPWEYKTSVHPGVWHGELAVAWSDLGVSGPPRDGEEWLFDLCRFSPGYAEQCKWSWLHGAAGFTDKRFMGRVCFDSRGWSFNLEPLAGRMGVNTGRLFVPMSRYRSGSLVWGLRILDERGEDVSRQSAILTPRRGDLFEWGFEYPLPARAVYTFAMSVQDPLTGEEVFRTTVPLRAQPDLDLAAKVFPFQKRVLVSVDSSRTGLPDTPQDVLRIALLQGEKPWVTADVPRIAPHQFKGDFSIRDTPPGAYVLHADVVGADGRRRVSAEQDLAIPPVPEWFGNTLGKSDAVLPPFTPVKADGLALSVWNRTYHIGSHGLPLQITTAGEPMLADPATLHLFSRGEPVPVALAGRAQLVASAATRAVVESVAPGIGLRFSSVTTVEYDGLMRIDFTLDPGAPLDVDTFYIRFPFRKDRARYVDAPVAAPPFHHVVDTDGWRLARSFTEGTAEVYGRFWLGDDDRGMDFSFLSDEGWRPYDRPDAVRIERTGDRVCVDLHILGNTRLEKPVRGTLLLTATPVRPFPGNVRHWNTLRLDQRLMQAAENGDAYASDALTTYADFGATVLMMSDYWSRGYGRPEPFDPASFARLVAAAKRLGMKVVVYIGVGAWAEHGPESPYMAEWEQIPAMRCASVRPDQTFITVALTRANGGHDCLLFLLDRMIREYDIDGVYVDGSGWAPNANRDIGFGYVDEAGTLRPTSTLLEIRELFQRISALFLARGKTPFIEHHCSWMLAAPVDSFCTAHLTGEYLAYRAHENTPFPEEWSRIENTGVQWGLPVEVLCYNTALWQRYIANTFLYGSAPATTLSNLTGSGNLEVIRALSPHWKAFLEFDAAGAEWIPYWKAGDAVRSDHPAHKLSFYRHPQQGLLLLLANTSPLPGTARLALNSARLGLAPGTALRVVNRPQQPFEFSGGILTVPLAGDDLILFRAPAK